MSELEMLPPWAGRVRDDNGSAEAAPPVSPAIRAATAAAAGAGLGGAAGEGVSEVSAASVGANGAQSVTAAVASSGVASSDEADSVAAETNVAGGGVDGLDLAGDVDPAVFLDAAPDTEPVVRLDDDVPPAGGVALGEHEDTAEHLIIDLTDGELAESAAGHVDAVSSPVLNGAVTARSASSAGMPTDARAAGRRAPAAAPARGERAASRPSRPRRRRSQIVALVLLAAVLALAAGVAAGYLFEKITDNGNESSLVVVPDDGSSGS